MKFELLLKKIFYMCPTSYALILEVKLQFGCKYKDFFVIDKLFKRKKIVDLNLRAFIDVRVTVNSSLFIKVVKS